MDVTDKNPIPVLDGFGFGLVSITSGIVSLCWYILCLAVLTGLPGRAYAAALEASPIQSTTVSDTPQRPVIQV